MESKKIANNQPQPQCGPQQPCGPKVQSDWDFDISRAYLLLTVTLVLPMYLTMSLLTFSLGALVA